MRERLLASLLSIGLSTLCGVAVAAPLNWEGTLQLDFFDMKLAGMPGAGIATLNGSNGGVPAHLATLSLAASRGGISGMGAAISSVSFISLAAEASLGSGSLAPISGAATTALTRRRLPVRGLLRVCFFAPNCIVSIPLDLTQATTMSGAKGVGIGGGLIGGSIGAVSVSFVGAPWTVATASAVGVVTTTLSGAMTLSTQTRMGFAHDPASGTTSTAQPGGVLQLVTPIQVYGSAPYFESHYANFGVLTVRFVPEPAMLVLLASGALALAWLGRLRSRA